MRALSQVALIIGVAVAGCPVTAPLPEVSAVSFPPDTRLRVDPANGTIIQASARDLGLLLGDATEYRRALDRGDLIAAALALIEEYRAHFRIASPREELVPGPVEADDLGYRHLLLNQVYQGLPVWGASLRVHFRPEGPLYLVQGRYHPTPSGLAVRPSLTTEQACSAVLQQEEHRGRRCLENRGLTIYVPPGGNPRLAYRLRIGSGSADSWEVLADAEHGGILNQFSLLQSQPAP